ncbi:MAG: hypothetical protein HQL22_03490 [Candidatus Omnitrophica bacterium]|nr:hypothetical protein [Candidatus Omnitrophota bacterium]
MNMFPMVDPIPLPAPVWLFKALHLLTLSLHFTAMEIFLGGLLLATLFCAFAGADPVRKGAGAALARRLPIVLTFVINFGVPPLLFTQVLYGIALYTSSELIGLYWSAVILLLMAVYFLLYKFSDGASAGRRVWWMGALAWILAACISKIYSTNMTLMLRPEVWPAMYAASPSGALLPPHDPTLIPRWLFMVTGAFWVSGLWLVWIAGRKTTAPALGRFLTGVGGWLAALMISMQVCLFSIVLNSQPAVVKAGIAGSFWLKGTAIAWLGSAVLVLVFALWVALKKTCSYAAGYIAALLTVLTLASWVILRDGIRDLTLASKGYDVWQQAVVTNWGVVGWFILTLVLGLVAMGWLIWVMMQAKPVSEGGIA